MASLYQIISPRSQCAGCLLRQKGTCLPRASGEASRQQVLRRTISYTQLLRVDEKDGPFRASAFDNEANYEKGRADGDGPTRKDKSGTLSRRLAEMTEDMILEGGRSARRNLQEAGFSEELKKRLEEKIKESAFKNEHAVAFSIANMPTSAGQGTRDIAAASPWQGKESVHDAALRMLDDSKKRQRVPSRIPQPTPVGFKLPSHKKPSSNAHRLANARDSVSTYAISQSTGLSDDEREAVRKELQQRFQAGARSLPMTIQGLASLANERIEDAMARGQFKNIPRGKGKNVERDHNANSAFIDTTEYFMNKIIQKQEIVPPWIEKQQELIREIDRFRSRLRNDWRRHAARLIASQGGSLQQQMRRAQSFAAAEARVAFKQSNKVPASSPLIPSDEAVLASHTQIDREGRPRMDTSPEGVLSTPRTSEVGETINTDLQSSPATGVPSEISNSTLTESSTTLLPAVNPLRDPEYHAIERRYHELQIKSINDLTRSYNLQAPRPAHKPYLNLERELNSCFVDVAPSLADEIRRRATERIRNPGLGTAAATSVGNGMIDLLTASKNVRIYDEDRSKGYGLKEFWKDLFWKKERARNRTNE